MPNVRMVIEEVDVPVPFEEEVVMADMARIVAVIDLQVLYMVDVQWGAVLTMVGLQVLFIQGVQRGAVLTTVGLQVLSMQGVQRGAVLIMPGMQVLFMADDIRRIVQIMAEMQALIIYGNAVDHQWGGQGLQLFRIILEVRLPIGSEEMVQK